MNQADSAPSPARRVCPYAVPSTALPIRSSADSASIVRGESPSGAAAPVHDTTVRFLVAVLAAVAGPATGHEGRAAAP